MVFNVLKTMLLSLAALSAHAQQQIATSDYRNDHCRVTHLLYQTPAPGTVLVHFNALNRGWTERPVAMKPVNMTELLEVYPSDENKEMLQGFKQEDGWYQYTIDTVYGRYSYESPHAVDFAFVTEQDGTLNWDNNDKKNYHAYSCGLWAVSNLHVQNPTLVQHKSEGIRVYYYSNSIYHSWRYNWQYAPYVHYREANGQWTTAPGVEMAMGPRDAGYFYGGTGKNWNFSPGFHWYFFDFNSSSVELVFTNGKGSWDNNDGKNYKLDAPGAYAFAPQLPRNKDPLGWDNNNN